MYDFTYTKPTAMPDALKALGADPDSKPLAGGQTYIPVLKQRLAKPTAIVDLSNLGLAGITDAGDKIRIGAMSTHHMIESSELIQRHVPGLAKMASWIGDTQVRHRGTMGGSLANNDPAACYPSAVLACGATIVTDKRSIPADEFFQGMFTTALEPGELITAVEFPKMEKSNYEKFRNPASRYAMVGVFVAKGPHGTRVAINGAGQGGVFRHTAMEQALANNWSADAIRDIKTPADDLNGDIHASPEYRAHLIGVMARRALEAA
ncbi:MAG: xanthine dehydrogenase family protein subunit M [Pseudomonadota bacterium]|nr:xanthine dehydrogenase family protein subunit M [Pseudomonadota bacterium]